MTQLVRRYDIGGLIAEGGMAEIVAASAMTEAGVSKRVALKRIRTASSGDPQFVARFFDEVRLAMQLSHANVVQVFDFGRTEADEFFLAMEFVEGVDLQRLRRVGGHERLPPGEALHVVGQMLRGLDYAHRRTDSDDRPLGIVHLDVKPANVLLSFEGEVKLADFGVARSRDARRPTVGISGTIPFMSPEQTRGEAIDLRSDVFSAGVLLYTLLAGTCPFGEADDAETLGEIQLCRYRPLPGVEQSERFEPLLRRALAASPGDRFPSAGAFADAIDELMFAQGWRGGAGALRDRLRAAFPHERERLNALFEPGKRREGLAVTPAASPREGTVLSRVLAAPAAAAPTRRTVIAAHAPRASQPGAASSRSRSACSPRWRSGATDRGQAGPASIRRRSRARCRARPALAPPAEPEHERAPRHARARRARPRAACRRSLPSRWAPSPSTPARGPRSASTASSRAPRRSCDSRCAPGARR